MFTDSHAHILSEYYNDIHLILKEAKEAGINRVINCGYDCNSSKEVIELIEKHK